MFNKLTQDKMQELFSKQEPLCDELQAYHTTTGAFPMVRHPLLYSVPHSDGKNAFLNFQFEQIKEAIKEMLEQKDYSGYVFAHEKPYRFNSFNEIKENLNDKEYWELLADIWSNSENIWQTLAGWKELLKCNRPGKHHFMTAEELSFYNSLPDNVTVYRGYTPGKNMAGLSFTLSEEKAQWFANRWQKKGKVLTMKIPKRKIFAYLSGRNEQEIIIV